MNLEFHDESDILLFLYEENFYIGFLKGNIFVKVLFDRRREDFVAVDSVFLDRESTKDFLLLPRDKGLVLYHVTEKNSFTK